jgi:hypothetical protein
MAHSTLSNLSKALGQGDLPPVEPIQTLFANLMGSLVLAWALLRIVRPLPVYGLVDSATRGLFAAWEAYAIVAHGVSGVLWFFCGAEIGFGILQVVPWLRALPPLNGTDQPLRHGTALHRHG